MNPSHLGSGRDVSMRLGDGDDWQPWVEQLLYGNGTGNQWYQDYWAANNGAPAEPYALDKAICWMNNPRDMLALQNQIHVYQGGNSP